MVVQGQTLLRNNQVGVNMRTLLFLTIYLISNSVFAQTTIERGVDFFRRDFSYVHLNVIIAEVDTEAKSREQADTQSSRRNFILGSTAQKTGTKTSFRISAIANSGLNFIGSLRFEDRNRYYDEFQGDLTLSSCIKDNGQNIFGQFGSLEEVLKYSREASELPQFSSCILTSPLMVANNYITPLGIQPRATLEDVRIYIFADRVEFTANIKGHPRNHQAEVEKKIVFPFQSPFLYYRTINRNHEGLRKARQETLGILQRALAILQEEIQDKRLPKTVAFILDNRQFLQSSLSQLSNNEMMDPRDLIEFSVSVKNAFHILDQAVGLASNRQIQMRELLNRNK